MKILFGQVRLQHAEGKLKGLTVDDLESSLVTQKVKSSAEKKDELIERVVQLLKLCVLRMKTLSNNRCHQTVVLR